MVSRLYVDDALIDTDYIREQKFPSTATASHLITAYPYETACLPSRVFSEGCRASTEAPYPKLQYELPVS